MRVCDFCQSKTKRADEHSIFIIKMAEGTHRSDDTLVDVQPDLCSDCSKKTRSALKKLIRDLKKILSK